MGLILMAAHFLAAQTVLLKQNPEASMGDSNSHLFRNNAEHRGTPAQVNDIRLIRYDSSQVKIRMSDYTIYYNKETTGGFLFIYPNGDSTGALATSFLSGSNFDLLRPADVTSITAIDTEDSLLIEFTTEKSWAIFHTSLVFYKLNPGLMHWQTSLRLLERHAVSSLDKEVLFYNFGTESLSPTSITKYADQDGYAAGLTYFYEADFLKSTILYFQDFSLSNPYYRWIHASPENTVGSSGANFGYSLPTSSANLPKNNTYILSSAYIYLEKGRPASELEMAERFLKGLSAIYKHIYKPVLQKRDWETIAGRTLQDLASDKCGVTVNGHRFLRAYVDIPRFDSAEMIAQLDVLTGIYRYKKGTGSIPPLGQMLEQNLDLFFNSDHQQVVNNYPNSGISQGDSWYDIELHIGLSQLAKMGSVKADTLLFRSIHSIIQFARTVNYDFPVFFAYDGYRKISGSEPDVAGGYAYLMLACYDLTDNSLYLDEAKKAIQHIRGKGLNLSYELQMSGAAVAAGGKLYRITGDADYLKLSYLALANIMRHCWIWESNYGTAVDYSTFFGMSPMPSANVITMKEQYETWDYLREFLNTAGPELPADFKILLQGFIDYTPNVLFYSLPPNLPEGARWTSKSVYDSQNDNSMYIPYEDLRDGWRKSGQIGQEIYGAGGVLSIAAVLKTSVEEAGEKRMPETIVLHQNFPNPFKTITTILFDVLPDNRSRKRTIQLKIYNTLGQEVRHLRKGQTAPGSYLFQWNGMDQTGRYLPGGVYFAVLSSANQTIRKKIILMR